MSCKHLMWGHYCKKRQEFCQDAFEDHEELCVNCSDYKDDNEVNDLNKIFYKGPVTDTSTADSDYVMLLEKFINNMYSEGNWRFINLDFKTAENRVLENMSYLGWNDRMVKDAFDKTVSSSQDAYVKHWAMFDAFIIRVNALPHKPYGECYPTSFRMVLTLILGYLGKLDSVAIIDCDDPKSYFREKVGTNLLRHPNLSAAVNKTRAYVEASKDSNLAEGMRIVEQWFEEVTKENIPAKELTIADIEKQLGYKIKIVGEDE